MRQTQAILRKWMDFSLQITADNEKIGYTKQKRTEKAQTDLTQRAAFTTNTYFLTTPVCVCMRFSGV